MSWPMFIGIFINVQRYVRRVQANMNTAAGFVVCLQHVTLFDRACMLHQNQCPLSCLNAKIANALCWMLPKSDHDSPTPPHPNFPSPPPLNRLLIDHSLYAWKLTIHNGNGEWGGGGRRLRYRPCLWSHLSLCSSLKSAQRTSAFVDDNHLHCCKRPQFSAVYTQGCLQPNVSIRVAFIHA